MWRTGDENMTSKSLDALQKGKGSQSRSPLQHPMICCFSMSKANIPLVSNTQLPPEQSRRLTRAGAWWMAPYKYMPRHAVISAQQAQAAEERSRMEVRGSSLLAKDDLPVATSECSLCNDNLERLLAVLRANHPGYQSASYASPCQAYSSLD